jgi:hypothetical protein
MKKKKVRGEKGKITNKKHTDLFDEKKVRDNFNLHKKKPVVLYVREVGRKDIVHTRI